MPIATLTKFAQILGSYVYLPSAFAGVSDPGKIISSPIDSALPFWEILIILFSWISAILIGCQP